MVLKTQDLLVTLKFAANRDRTLSTTILSNELGLALGEVSGALKRATASQLLAPSGLTRTKGRPIKGLIINRVGLLEFLIHGVRYVFIPDRGKLTRGMPTAHAASPMRNVLVDSETHVVWPDSKGEVRGESFSPLHPAAVKASRRDPNLYALLTLVDGIRGGSAREREVASQLLTEHLHGI